jgi:peptidoglycan/LPS O-acetylase OafA/YrhL
LDRRRDIEGLRAIAVLSVLLFHYHIGAFTGGYIGVDIFFVISGYVIAGSILNDIEENRFSIVNFYFKRIRRIFPALAATIGVVSIASAIILLPTDLVNYSRSVSWASAFLSNIYFWRESGYFTAEAQTKPLLHTWSLAVEEQYYIFAPLAFYFVYRFGRGKWLWFVGPLILVSLGVSVFAVFVGPTAGFFLLPTRIWELLLGAAGAFVGRSPSIRSWRSEWMAAIGLGLIFLGLFALDDRDPFPGWNALIPCIGTILIIMAAVGRGAEAPRVNRLLASAPLVTVGAISYSLYLVHWPIAAFTRYLTLRDPTLAEAGLMIAASFAFAWLSGRYIEKPFRHIGPGNRWKVLSAGAAVIAVGIFAGSVGVALKGLPQRFPDLVELRIPGTEDWGGDQCFNQNPASASLWDPTACTRIHGQNGRILLWGDSFAAQYAPGILRDAKRINADVLQYTFAGCPPILSYFSYGRVACSPFNRRALDVIRSEHIDTVVLAGRWTDTPLRTIEDLGETVDTLTKMGLRVFVFGQSPQFAADVQHLDYISGSRLQRGVAYWSLAFDLSLNQRISGQSPPGTFVDPLAYLCDGRQCAYRDGGTFYYADYGHFSTAGSLRAVKAYFPAGVLPAKPLSAGSIQ